MEDTPEKDSEANTNFVPPDSAAKASKRLDFNHNTEIPDIPVRVGYRSVDPRICQLLVDLESKFGIEARRSGKVLAYIANSELFQQKWEVREWDEDDIIDLNDSEDNVAEPQTKKRKRSNENLTHVLPSRRTVAQYVKDTAILNFKHMGECLIAAKDAGNAVATFGVDDTTKAAGHKTMDVKTGHLTIVKTGEAGSTRQTFSTGYLENISHSGFDSASGVQSWLSQMAILTGVSYQELIEMFDFWITDRAGDSDTCLDELGVESEKRMKCNAHILHCVDQAMD